MPASQCGAVLVYRQAQEALERAVQRAMQHRLGEAGVTHRVPWKRGALALAETVFRKHAKPAN